MNKEIFIVKLTALGKKTAGVIYLVLNVKEGCILTLDCAFTSEIDGILPPVNLSRTDFEKALSQYKQQYILNSQITIPLQNLLRDIFSPEKIKHLQGIGNVEEEISRIISKAIKDVTGDDIQINIELNFDEEKKEGLDDSSREEEREEKEKEIEIYIKSQVAIDPVHGKTIFELCRGDKLLVKAVDDRPIAEYLSSLLISSSGDKDASTHICAPAYRAEELGENKYRLIVKFGPGVYGETIILPSVKVKTVEEEVKKKEVKSQGVGFVVTPLMFTQVLLLVLLIALVVFARIIE